VKNLVSKFAFQVHNLQRYSTGQIDSYYAALGMPKLEYRSLRFEEGLCRLNQVDP
jgi:UDP-galactopyranose mutase